MLCRSLGYQIEWHTYPMEHSVCMEEVLDISKWLQARLPESKNGNNPSGSGRTACDPFITNARVCTSASVPWSH